MPKGESGFCRMQVSSDASLYGKLFAEFITLIYLPYIKKKVYNTDLLKNCRLHGLFEK